MRLRSQRLDRPRHRDYLPGGGWPPGTRESVTALTEHDVLTDDSYTATEFALGLLVPDCVHTHGRSPRGTQIMWLYGLTDRSWAAAFFNEDDPAQSQVYQGGPLDLWDEVEAAYRWWAGQKRPEHGEFGLTVTPDGRQEVWLREPSALLPRAAPTR